MAIGYQQRVGELCNDAELIYTRKMEQELAGLREADEETETTRKAKLNSRTAEEKHDVIFMKNLYSNLKSLRMMLHSAIKTRREER